MPIININNCNYNYEIHGYGEDILVFSHGLLWNSGVFINQIEYFKSKYSILIYDQCGHGQSMILDGNFKSRCLYKDVIKLLDHLKLKQVHFVGLSMGADIAIRIALKRPNLIKSLVLISASVSPESNNRKYSLLNNIVKFSGIKAVLQPVLVNMFSIHFLNDPNRKEELKKWTTELLKNDKEIHITILSALKRKNIDLNDLLNISCPTLILAGTEDKATPLDNSKLVHSMIKNSILRNIEGSGHMVNIEDPETCNYEMEQFLDQFNN